MMSSAFVDTFLFFTVSCLTAPFNDCLQKLLSFSSLYLYQSLLSSVSLSSSFSLFSTKSLNCFILINNCHFTFFSISIHTVVLPPCRHFYLAATSFCSSIAFFCYMLQYLLIYAPHLSFIPFVVVTSLSFSLFIFSLFLHLFYDFLFFHHCPFLLLSYRLSSVPFLNATSHFLSLLTSCTLHHICFLSSAGIFSLNCNYSVL